MVRSDGSVVLSLETQTEFDGLHDNILDFVDSALAVSHAHLTALPRMAVPLSRLRPQIC